MARDARWMLGLGVAAALAAAIGIWVAYTRWVQPPPSPPAPVSQFTGLLMGWELEPLPRPSSVVEPGALLSGRLKWLVSRKKAWTNADSMELAASPVLSSATYVDTRESSGKWRTVLPGLGAVARLESTLGLTNVQSVETHVEGAEVVEVPESELTSDLLTDVARKHLTDTVIIVREVCRIRRLTYRFKDKTGKRVGLSTEVAKTQVEGELARSDTSNGELVLENVCIAFGRSNIVCLVPTGSTTAEIEGYLAKLDPARKSAVVRDGVIFVETSAREALGTTTFLDTQWRIMHAARRLDDRSNVEVLGAKRELEAWRKDHWSEFAVRDLR
jgi:hypothetical protein